MPAGQTRLFVYGTLKQGHCSHARLNGAVLLGPAATLPGHLLVDCGNYPGLVAAPDPGDGRVHGELYLIPDSMLAALDDYEDVDGGEYERRGLLVTLGDGSQADAQSYFYLRPWHHLPVAGENWLPGYESGFSR